MFYSALKNKLTFRSNRREIGYVSFSQVKFLVFEAQPVFSKFYEVAPLDEQDRISITSTPSLHYRAVCTIVIALLSFDKKRAFLQPQFLQSFQIGRDYFKNIMFVDNQN